MKKKKILKIVFVVLICLAIIGIITVIGINNHVKNVGGRNIITPEEATKIDDIDCIVVLGCQVKDDGKPSDMLADRLRRGIELYNQGVAPKIIMSGDHGQKEYDEVNTMKQVAVDAGIPSNDIFMDHAGFSTYESLYRAKEIFEADKIIVVTQKYHLYRAVYNARKLGLDAYGVAADGQYNYSLPVRTYNNTRESIARCKDFIWCIFKPEPTYLGEAIPISSSGVLTDDKVK